jgi:hypothetical protein
MALVLAMPAWSTSTGTQDFVLINQSGSTIYSLYVSESARDDWEEDILGDNTLLDGGRLKIVFSGRAACLWDILAEDPDGNQLEWSSINLCEVSVVVLKCNDDECWAEFE